MKAINNYISEKLIINRNTCKKHYNYFPETKNELINIIDKRIAKEGNKCDLNDIDVSKITDMSLLFNSSNFNGDISNWDISNVKDMDSMFFESKFNQDISNWDVSNVEDMEHMFYCSKFNQNISKWKINNKCNINGIFDNSPLKGKEKEWWHK